MIKNRKLVSICYDHIGGVLGEAFFKFFLREKWIEQNDNEYIITKKGWEELEIIGIDVFKLQNSNRKILNICIEKNLGIFHEHIGSYLGLLMFEHLKNLKWLKEKNGNSYELTDKGVIGLKTLGVDIKKMLPQTHIM